MEGHDAQYHAEGCPHKTKIVRKPEGMGAELKALAGGESGILLKLDIMEGKETNQKKALSSEFGEGTAITLCLTDAFIASGRTVICDSAFGSVKTLLALRVRGLHFMGMVKTAHSLNIRLLT